MFVSWHFPWRSHSVLFVILYVAVENFRMNFPYCLKSALFAVQISIFLYSKCSLNSVWRRCRKHESSGGSANAELNGGGSGTEERGGGGRRRCGVLLTALVSNFFYILLHTVKPVAVLVGVALSQVTLMWLLHRARLGKALQEHGEALRPFNT